MIEQIEKVISNLEQVKRTSEDMMSKKMAIGSGYVYLVVKDAINDLQQIIDKNSDYRQDPVNQPENIR